MSTRPFGLAVSALLLTLPTQYAFAQVDHAHHQEGSTPSAIGRVAFETSCSPRAQVEFEKGIALLHSFWYEEATKEFDAASAADPACAMAHWGHAMSLFHQLWEAPDTATRRQALTALDSARKVGSPTPRERAYIDALATYFELKSKPPADTVASDARMQAYRNAMQAVARGFPGDDEAGIFYALAIIAAAPTGDTTFKDERRADSLLLPLAKKYPTHPGVMHYIIHANDDPVLAPLALDAARRYAQLAPAIPHAQHMPSHIFIRLGLWDDVIASNTLATESGTVYEHQEKMDGEWWHNAHTMDFLQYGLLQEGRDREAQQVVDKMSHIQKLSGLGNPDLLRFFQVFFAARQLLERGQWREAASLRLTSPADSSSTWSTFVLAFTRGLGAARVGDVALARAEITRLDSLHGHLVEQKDTAGARDAANTKGAASAWLQLALGNRDEAARLAHQAAVNENDAAETPLVPASELEGELLLAVGRPMDARHAFELSLRRNPNRARSLFGAGYSASQAGDPTAARRFYTQYVALMARGDGNRSELVTAKEFLAAR
jgi:tetratricopeptide (TPR) repeat protein